MHIEYEDRKKLRRLLKIVTEKVTLKKNICVLRACYTHLCVSISLDFRFKWTKIYDILSGGARVRYRIIVPSSRWEVDRTTLSSRINAAKPASIRR